MTEGWKGGAQEKMQGVREMQESESLLIAAVEHLSQGLEDLSGDRKDRQFQDLAAVVAFVAVCYGTPANSKHTAYFMVFVPNNVNFNIMFNFFLCH